MTAEYPLTTLQPELVTQAKITAQKFNLIFIPFDDLSTKNFLLLTPQHLELHSLHNKKPFYIDFLQGPLAYRVRNKQKELITKAVGIKNDYKPTVLDVTGGLGRDGFILANAGCTVTLIERSSVIAALLDDALLRLVKPNLTFIYEDASCYLKKITELPDVIYLDPMYPERKKSALVKQEMRLLKEIVGADEDAGLLLDLALQKTKKRVVVKRPITAESLNNHKPDFIIKGTTQRFDVYLISQI